MVPRTFSSVSPTGLAFSGLAYGIALAGASVLAAGAGHGCYVLMGLASSPLGIVPADNILLALMGMPFLWCAVGLLVGLSTLPRWRIAFLAVMAVHYACLWPILHDGPYSDWSYLEKVEGVIYCGFGIYAAGQIAIWILFAATLLHIAFERQQKVGLCLKCGYDLRASRDRCPECGTPFSRRGKRRGRTERNSISLIGMGPKARPSPAKHRAGNENSGQTPTGT